LGGIAPSAAPAGLVFGIGGFAEDDLVAVGSGQADQRFAVDPSSNRLAFGFGIIFVRIFFRLAEDGFDMGPVAAGFDDDEFVSAAGFAEFRGVTAGRDPDGFLVDERAALCLGGGEWRDEQERCGEKNESESHISIIGCCGVACNVLSLA
jgi:hypothetical protein